MNSGHRDYPGSGHPEVNSPTSCFDCIISLSWWSFTTPLSLAWPTERCSSVAHSGWKKNRDQLPSILLSSGVLFQSESPLMEPCRPLLRREQRLAGEASRFARGSSGNLADSPLVKGDAPRSARPACSGRGGVARRLSCPSSHLSLLRAGEVRHGKCHDGPPRESSNSQRWSVCLVVDH